jgi:hypothetical protein
MWSRHLKSDIKKFLKTEVELAFSLREKELKAQSVERDHQSRKS